MKKRYIIIGSSAAGMGVLSRLRSLDKESEIVCISASHCMPYNTCLIADYVAALRPETDIYTRQQSFFDENRIELRLATTVVKLIPHDKKIVLSDGEALSYDSLFLGLGTRAAAPAIAGECTIPLFSFHTLEDAQKLLSFIKEHKPSRALVIGAGLSGIECADALVAQGVNVTIVERASGVLPSQVNQAGSRLIEAAMKNHGVAFYKNSSVIAFEKDGACLSNGTMLRADCIIMAVGSIAHINLAQQAGITIVNGGIAVNEYCETSETGIYAGGDCASVINLITGAPIRSTMWPDALMQGMNAAHSMAGIRKPYPGVVIVGSSRFFGSSFVSCGAVVNPPTNAERIEGVDEKSYRLFVIDNERLVGFLMIGEIRAVGLLKKLVSEKQIVSRHDLLAL